MGFGNGLLRKAGKTVPNAGIIILVFLTAPGCQRDKPSTSPSPQDIELQLVAMSDCKSQSLQKSMVDTTSDYDCIEYEYLSGTLNLHHINAGFNCCPEIETQIEVENDVITITEIEIAAQCDCDCLFDLDLAVLNLPPEEYRIRVIEPYIYGDDEELDFTVDLADDPDGIFCVERHHYPWDMD
jgi:hypothetical protein